MSKEISSTTLMYSILAVNSEADIQRDYLDSDEIPADDIENEEGILDDLEQALMELIDVYKSRCKAEPDLPSIDELLGGAE
ncbi:MAG: hypothetical protein PHC99_06935 [Methylococcales bacterium]|nr:hypothetical protein [Methylococcales bacterium]